MRTISLGLLGMLAALIMPGQVGSGNAHGDVAAPATVQASCQLSAPEITGMFPYLLDTELPDGTVVLGGSYLRAGKLVTVLQAVLPDCRPAPGFGQHGTARVSLAVRSASATIDVIEAGPDGKILLGGGVGPYLLVGRLLADGRVDPGFGTSGWERLPAPVQPPKGVFFGNAITSLALGPAGVIYLGGNDGTAHCCVEDFVGAVSLSGVLERSFGNRGWAVLPVLGGSYETGIFPGDSGILVMGFIMYTGCGGPVLARLGPRGQLDETFDATVRHSLATATGTRYALIDAALYSRPGGGLAVVGDLMPSGCLSPVPKVAEKGLALGLLGNGKIDPSFGTSGRTTFTYGGSSGTWAVPLPAGPTIVVTEQVSAGVAGAPRALKVRELSPEGRFKSTFGHSGSSMVGLAWASVPNSYPAIDVKAGPDGSAVIIVAAREHAKIYRLQG